MPAGCSPCWRSFASERTNPQVDPSHAQHEQSRPPGGPVQPQRRCHVGQHPGPVPDRRQQRMRCEDAHGRASRVPATDRQRRGVDVQATTSRLQDGLLGGPGFGQLHCPATGLAATKDERRHLRPEPGNLLDVDTQLDRRRLGVRDHDHLIRVTHRHPPGQRARSTNGAVPGRSADRTPTADLSRVAVGAQNMVAQTNGSGEAVAVGRHGELVPTPSVGRDEERRIEGPDASAPQFDRNRWCRHRHQCARGL